MGLLSFIGNIGKTASNVASAFVKNNPWIQAGGALAEGLGSIGASMDQNALNQKSMDFQREMLDAQQNFNASESQKTRDFNAEQAQLSRDFNSAQAEKSRQFQVDQWNRENEYNTPKAQLERMVEAGLNPLGQDFSATGASASPTEMASSGAPASSAPASVGLGSSPALANPSLAESQVELNRATARNLEAKTKTEDATRDGIIRLQGMQYDSGLEGIALSKSQRAVLEQQANQLKTSTQALEQEIANGKLREELLKMDLQQREIELKHLEERIEAELKESASRYDLNLANAKELASRIVVNYAQANLYKKQADLAEQQMYTEAWNTVTAEQNSILAGFDAKFVNEHGDKIASFKYKQLEEGEFSLSVEHAEGERRKAHAEDMNKPWVRWYDEFCTSTGKLLGGSGGFSVTKVIK